MKEYILCIILGIILYFIIQDSINKFSVGAKLWHVVYDDHIDCYYNRLVSISDLDYAKVNGKFPNYKEVNIIEEENPEQAYYEIDDTIERVMINGHLCNKYPTEDFISGLPKKWEDDPGDEYILFGDRISIYDNQYLAANDMITDVIRPEPEPQQRSLWERLLQCASSINQ